MNAQIRPAVARRDVTFEQIRSRQRKPDIPRSRGKNYFPERGIQRAFDTRFLFDGQKNVLYAVQILPLIKIIDLC